LHGYKIGGLRSIYSNGTVFYSYVGIIYLLPKTFTMLMMLSFIQTMLLAQDSTSTSTSTTKTTTTESTTWYTQPWIWVVGAVLLLIVIIALMRGNSSSATEKTTVIKD